MAPCPHPDDGAHDGSTPFFLKFGRSFWALNAAQFLGALNDNLFKLLAVLFAIAQLGRDRMTAALSLGGAIFVLPFLLFTPAAGVLADRISKRTIIVAAKALEIVVMALAVVAFAFRSVTGGYMVLFLMATQSALFGPSKYGIIPELVPCDRLSPANGSLTMFTYLAIIIGSALGPALADAAGGHFALAAAVCVLIAAAGTATSLAIRSTPAAGSRVRPSLWMAGDVIRTLRTIRHDRHLLTAVFASAYFSLVGAYLQLNVIPFGTRQLGLSETQSAYLFFIGAAGIGAGAWLAGRLSGRLVEFGVVPLGALTLSIAIMRLGALGADGLRAAYVWIGLAGVGAGLYLVPLDTFIQCRSPVERRGEVLAASGFLSWVGVLIGSLAVYLFDAGWGWGPGEGFVAMGVVTLAAAGAAIYVLPDFLIRFLAMLLTRSIYRLRICGLEHVPIQGGALLVSNHVSLMDALQILAVQPRRVRFLMHRRLYENRWMKPLWRLMGVIPIATGDSPRRLAESLAAARRALDEGFLVCIFAEGRLTQTGLMRGFRPGFQRILRGRSEPIIPVYIGGTWGSLFSHYYGPQRWRLPARFPYPVTIVFGRPLPPNTPPHAVRQAVMELSCDYFESRKPLHRSLAAMFIHRARRKWNHPGPDDTFGVSMTWGRALVGAVALARALRPTLAGQSRIGLLLPPSAGGALANLALALLRKTAVNLNPTVSEAAFRSALRQADLRTILTARPVIERFPQWAGLEGLIFLEEVRQSIGPGAKIFAWLQARFAPIHLLTPMRGAGANDEAIILFSSGTTGEPKGVVLTHHNIASNIEGVSLLLRPRSNDRIAATLPFFHSFGLTCGLWLPAISGMAVSFHTSPLDAAKVVAMVRERRCTALFSTPTFLQAYFRRSEKGDFASLRLIVAGAERLRPELARAFEEKHGVAILEGYGTTELSPVAALSVPDAETDGVYQAGHKPGSVGQPIPGCAARIVDPDTDRPCPPHQPGLLIIRGPNVMAGYLNRPDLTADAIRGGWYRTGDIATMDEESFITITDRLARFSKIGGEMVPHRAIEDIFAAALGTAETVLAVTSAPCPRKGEQLVVLYTPAAGDAERLRAIMDTADLPNLWKPAYHAYVPVPTLPVTATGKLDVRELRRIAGEALAEKNPSN